MRSNGTLYILQAYDFRENQLVKKKTLFGREKKLNVSYIASLSFDKGGTTEYEYDEASQALMRSKLVNELVPDRVRYIEMSRHLSEYGYTVKRK